MCLCNFIIYFLTAFFLDIDFHLFLQPGVEVSVEEIEQAVNEVFEENKNVILEQRYRTNGE